MAQLTASAAEMQRERDADRARLTQLEAEKAEFTKTGTLLKTLGPIRGYNIGGDYKRKRLLLLDWPEMTVTAHEFGDQ